jgi:hypothetical protein
MDLVAAHQPNLLPHLGFFAKWAAAKTLVLLDRVQYVRKSARGHYTNRCLLGDGRWYTIPVSDHFPQTIGSVEIVPTWEPRSLIDRVRNDYRDTDHLDEVEVGLSKVLSACHGCNLATLNVYLLRWAAGEIGIDRPAVLQSDTALDDDDPDARLIYLTKTFGSAYLSGPKGPDYMRPDVWREVEVPVYVTSGRYTKYPRGSRPWMPGLSVVDALCYVGGARTRDLLRCEVERWI